MSLPRLGLAVLVAAGLATTAFAQGAVDAPIAHYRRAAGTGELGTVRGRAFEERRRPSASDLPLTGTVVTLLPRSDAWLHRLATLKRGARESMDAYRATAGAVRRSFEAYERSLWEAGAGDLAQTATVDGEGIFKLDGLPAGPWILLASRASYVSKTPSVRPPGGAPRNPAGPSPFIPGDSLAGYHVVTYWMREVTVAAGAAEAIELTDRNAWLTGVLEDRAPAPLPDAPYAPIR